MPQGFKAHLIVFVVDIHNGQGKQELDQRHHKHVARIVEKGGQRPAHHVAHGDIEERHQENERGQKPPLHTGGLFLHPIDLLRLGRHSFDCREGGSVARLLHRVDDLPGVGDTLVVVHHHGVAQQIHIDPVHAGHFAHGLFHMSRTRRAGHALYIELLLHGLTISSFYFKILPSVPINSSTFWLRSSGVSAS